MLKKYLVKNRIEVGCDEAGRGCIAGPVFAAAVILPQNFKHPLLNDSKQLTEKQREILRPIIEAKAIAWSVESVTEKKIDDINILNASILAMHKAIASLSKMPEHILVDGNRFKAFNEIPHSCIIKGDSKFASIAAASVLAKTHRDELMNKLHLEYPHFLWDRNKGYPTIRHRDAVKTYGISPYHRKSFRILPTQLSMDL